MSTIFKELTLQHNNWGDSRVDTLFVRPVYETALGDIAGHSTALIEGTTGVGKSMFIFYFMHRKVREAINGGLKIPTFLFEKQDASGVKTSLYFFISGGNAAVVNQIDPLRLPYGSDLPDYYITDSCPTTSACANIQVLHVSSSGNSNFLNYLLKTFDEIHDGISILFPPFSFPEYVLADGNPTDHNTNNAYANVDLLHFQFDVFGGCLRLLSHCCEQLY